MPTIRSKKRLRTTLARTKRRRKAAKAAGKAPRKVKAARSRDAYDRQSAASPGRAATATRLEPIGVRETPMVREAQESAEQRVTHRGEYQSQPGIQFELGQQGRRTARVRRMAMDKHAEARRKAAHERELSEARRELRANVPLLENMASKAIEAAFPDEELPARSRLNVRSGEFARSRKASIDRGIEKREVGPIARKAARTHNPAGMPQEPSLPVDQWFGAREHHRRRV